MWGMKVLIVHSNVKINSYRTMRKKVTKSVVAPDRRRGGARKVPPPPSILAHLEQLNLHHVAATTGFVSVSQLAVHSEESRSLLTSEYSCLHPIPSYASLIPEARIDCDFAWSYLSRCCPCARHKCVFLAPPVVAPPS